MSIFSEMQSRFMKGGAVKELGFIHIDQRRVALREHEIVLQL